MGIRKNILIVNYNELTHDSKLRLNEMKRVLPVDEGELIVLKKGKKVYKFKK